nr:uncharacterized protein LOC124810538 [Hydra vulgaris]
MNRYEIEGDDTSDEESEKGVYKNLKAENYNKINTKIRVDMLHQLKFDDEQAIKFIINELLTIENFLTKTKKVSKQKQVRTKVKNLISYYNSKIEEDSKCESEKLQVNSAVWSAYTKCKGKKLENFISCAKSNLRKKTKKSGNQSNDQFIDLKWSLIFQDLGTRLLASDSVRNLYFQNKIIIGKFENLPTDETIKASLNEMVNEYLDMQSSKIDKELLKSYILNDESYTKLVNRIINDEKKIFSLMKPRFVNSLKALLKTMDNLIIMPPHEKSDEKKTQSCENTVKNYIDNRIDYIKDNMKIFITKHNKVSKHKHVMTLLKNMLDNESFCKFKDCLVCQAILSAYKQLTKGETIDSLKELANKIFESYGVQDFNYDLRSVLILEKILSKLKSDIIYPVLADHTSFSFRNITENASKYNVEALFCYLRVKHCSAKRFIKNAKLIKDFDGAEFSRGWQFDSKKNICN